MHLLMMAIALILAWMVRLLSQPTGSHSPHTWGLSLFCFLFSPLLLLATAIAVLFMGASGEMFGLRASWFGYIVALCFVVFGVVLLLQLAYRAYKSQQQINTYSPQVILGKEARILATSLPYSAQIGWWRSRLVISQGLLATLDTPHLEAVLAHEQAHCHYRDTFWFFWLGWLRSFTSWLPNTELLWQELLLLRELRADRRAAGEIDSLLLAESLLAVAKAPLMQAESFCAPFSCAVPRDRLGERIDALLQEDNESISTFSWWTCIGILLAFIPLVTIPLHY